MVERGVLWTPTLSLFDRMAHDRDMSYVSGAPTRRVRERDSASQHRAVGGRPAPPPPCASPWERTVELAGRAHAAGVRLAVGTDAGMTAVFHGLAVHRELELLVRAGLTPSEALSAATGCPPRRRGAGGVVGTIEVGKEADLLLLRDDPLTDIRNTRAIDLVVKRGVRYDPDTPRVTDGAPRIPPPLLTYSGPPALRQGPIGERRIADRKGLTANSGGNESACVVAVIRFAG